MFPSYLPHPRVTPKEFAELPMLTTNTTPSAEQQEELDSTLRELLQTQSLNYVTKAFEVIRTIQNYTNNLLLLQNHYRYDLYLLTVTWIQTPFCNVPDSVQKDFNRLYLRVLLPYMTNKVKFSSKSYANQPICIASVEKGNGIDSSIGNQASLHNHGIIAARGLVSGRLKSLSQSNLKSELMRFCNSTLKNRRLEEAKTLLSFLSSIQVKKVTEPRLQIAYPFKQLGQFYEYVSMFPSKIDWSDITPASRTKRLQRVEITSTECEYVS
jgi:hypothetical protein